MPSQITDLETLTQLRLDRVGVKPLHQKIVHAFLGELKAHVPWKYTHGLRVGIYADNLKAKEGDEHRRLALMGGDLHDIGICKLRKELFDGRNITPAEYEEIKTHAYEGFLMLKDCLPLTAMVVGMHHWKEGTGYGATLKQLPFVVDPKTRALLVRTVRTVSIADYFDAVQTRNDPRFGLDKEDRQQVTEAIRKEYRLKPNDATSIVKNLYDMRFSWQGSNVHVK